MICYICHGEEGELIRYCNCNYGFAHRDCHHLLATYEQRPVTRGCQICFPKKEEEKDYFTHYLCCFSGFVYFGLDAEQGFRHFYSTATHERLFILCYLLCIIHLCYRAQFYWMTAIYTSYIAFAFFLSTL